MNHETVSYLFSIIWFCIQSDQGATIQGQKFPLPGE